MHQRAVQLVIFVSLYQHPLLGEEHAGVVENFSPSYQHAVQRVKYLLR